MGSGSRDSSLGPHTPCAKIFRTGMYDTTVVPSAVKLAHPAAVTVGINRRPHGVQIPPIALTACTSPAARVQHNVSHRPSYSAPATCMAVPALQEWNGV